jgi:hypothetical protein
VRAADEGTTARLASRTRRHRASSTPPGQTADYIKRAIGFPATRVEMIEGSSIINGKP